MSLRLAVGLQDTDLYRLCLSKEEESKMKRKKGNTTKEKEKKKCCITTNLQPKLL